MSVQANGISYLAHHGFGALPPRKKFSPAEHTKIEKKVCCQWPYDPSSLFSIFQKHRLNSFIMLSLTHLFVLSSSLWLLQVALVSLTASQKPKGAYTKSNVDENGLIAIYTALRLAPRRCCLQRKQQGHVELCLKTPQSKSIKVEI